MSIQHDRMTPTERATEAAYHTQAATNGIATVAGHIAKLRELNTVPARDATYRHMLAELDAISADVRAQATAQEAAA